MIEQSGNNALLSITAKPNSRKFAVEIKGDKLVVWLESRAENNRANIELLKELRRTLNKDVSLVSGEKSKTKKVIVYNATKEDVIGALKAKAMTNAKGA